MQRRRLGGSGPWTSALGLGCMGLSQGYGPTDDTTSAATVRRALDRGITLVDTAMSYGSGHNEELVGRAIAGRRDEVVLATKGGIVRDAGGVRVDGRPEAVQRFCDASLARLGVDVVDLYYLHRVDPGVPLAETVGAMAGLVAAGKVRHLGICEVGAEGLEAAVAVHPIAAVQVEWSLAWREPEDDLVPAARRLGVAVVPYSPLGRGLLTGALPSADFSAGDFRHGDPRFAGENLARNRAVVMQLRTLADEFGVTVAQLALAWLLAQGDDVVPIPGTRRPERVDALAAAAGLELTPEDLARIEAVAGRDSWVGDRRSFAAHTSTRSPVAPSDAAASS